MSRVLVLGAGVSGRAAEALLRAQGCDVLVLEGEVAFPCGDRNVAAPAVSRTLGCAPAEGAGVGAQPSARETAEGRAFLSPQEEEFDFAVVSPGIALTHPWIVEAKRRGIPLKSELQLGCEELKRRGWKLLAVTGSKGKSSVVKVVADAINLAGMKAVACGNYGVPVCEVARGCGDRNVAAPAVSRALGCAPTEGAGVGARPSASETAEGRAFLSPQPGWAVVEVSSFMMETTELPADTFEAAAILNLQEDHLDRHGSVEVYHGLKRKLLKMAKLQFDLSPYPDFEALYKAFLDDDVRDFLGGSYFDNDVLAPNGVAALTLMLQGAKVDRETARRAFDEFVPLPHRMNLVAEVGGVRYVDDSKATSISALVAGVKMCQKVGFRRASNWMRALCAGLGRSRCEQNPRSASFVRLIAGGLPKGDDPQSALATLTSRVKKVYLIGQCAEVFSAAWKGAVDCEICGTMERAVEAAKREAEKGETVLLSPGTASFDQFQSYGERGDVFARLVKKEGQPK